MTRALLALIVVGYLAHAGVFVDQLNDDAFITFRYSRNLASGLGPYYNPGEHVEGYTNFLLMALLAPAFALGGEQAPLLAAKALGLIGGVAALVVVYLLAKELGRGGGTDGSARAAGLLAAAIAAASPGFAQNSSTGLETTLYAALLVAGSWLGVRGIRENRWRGAGLLFGAALLTRPEGALVFAVFFCAAIAASARPLLDRLREALSGGVGLAVSGVLREPLVLDALSVTGIFLAHLLFRVLVYDGEWLPNTYFAKRGGFWLLPPGGYLRGGMLAPLLGPAGLVAATAGLAFARPRWGLFLAVASIPIAGSALLYLTGTDWMPGFRLLVPYLPLAAVVVAFGWVGLAGALARRWAWAGPAAVISLVPLAFLAQEGERRSLKNQVGTRTAGYVSGHQALAAWLRQNAAPGSSVALMDIGIVGYRCPDLRIIDVSGLTDRHIAKSPGLFLRKEYDPAYVFNLRPDFIVLVMWAPGDPERPPSPTTAWRSWSPAEGRLAQSREFVRYTSRGLQPPDQDWKRFVAWKVGAEQVFEHRHPGRYYLLGLYRRKT